MYKKSYENANQGEYGCLGNLNKVWQKSEHVNCVWKTHRCLQRRKGDKLRGKYSKHIVIYAKVHIRVTVLYETVFTGMQESFRLKEEGY